MIPFSQLLSQVPLLSSLLGSPTPLHPDINNSPISVSRHGSCPKTPSLSCPSSPPDSLNTCCVNHPSGHFLQTQFWDTSPPVGPNDSWTIHGLWPDLCSGGFDQFCDNTRSHEDIAGVIRRAFDEDQDASQPAEELLAFMQKYWLAMDGNDQRLWSHEWNKHGTCISTLEPDCYPAPEDPLFSSSHRHHHVDVLDYFIHTTSLFRTLDTYTILADADIIPSHTQRYTLRDLEDAVSSSRHGHPVTFRCNRRGELDEIWYHFSVMGSLRHSTPPHRRTTGRAAAGQNEFASPFLNATSVAKHFIPAPPDGILSNCPRKGIKYLPKNSRPSPPHAPTQTRTRTHPAPSPTNTGPPFSGKGHLEVHVLDTTTTTEKRGCLITHGEWYVSGTCATFRSKRDVVDPGHQPLFSLSSSYSPCLVNPANNKFECSQQASVQGIFSSSVDDAHVLAYQNSSIFYADKVPSRWDKVDLFADDDGGRREVQVEIHWVSV
jgi:ribonuclease T2